MSLCSVRLSVNPGRMLKKTVQRGRSKRKAESYSVLYVEALSDARTKLADFFSLLLDGLRAEE
jgi:hypothetical protein